MVLHRNRIKLKKGKEVVLMFCLPLLNYQRCCDCYGSDYGIVEATKYISFDGRVVTDLQLNL
jgi:hypothetical protein